MHRPTKCLACSAPVNIPDADWDVLVARLNALDRCIVIHECVCGFKERAARMQFIPAELRA